MDSKLVYYRLLGLYGKTHSEVDLDSFNKLAEKLGVNPLTDGGDLVDLLATLTEGTPEYTEYLKFKSGEGDPYELLLRDNTFIDNQGHQFKLDNEDMIKLIKLLQTNQELKNGNFNVKQFNRAAKNIRNFRESDELLEFLMDSVSRLSTVNNAINESDNQKLYVESSSFDTIAKLNMKQRELQNLSRKYNALKREVFDGKLFRDKVLSELKNIKLSKPIEVKYQKCMNPNTSTLIVPLSDVHVGLKTKDFDKDILKKRLHDYVVSIAEYTYSHDIDDIYIVNLGDTIENIYMHLNQMATVEMDLSHQVAMAVKYVVEFVQDVRNLGYNTYYIGIMGNHDRLNPNTKQNIVGDGVSTIINAYIEANQDIMDIKYVEPFSTIRHMLSIHGKNIALVHGDYDKVAKPDVISKLSEFFDDKVDVVLSGHYHNLFIKTLGKGQYVLQNGAFFTGNPYSDSLGVSANASQILVGIDTHGNIDLRPVIFK